MTNAEILIELLDTLLSNATQIDTLLKTAQSQGRDVTQDELNALFAQDDAAKAALVAAIAKAQAAA